MYSREYANPQQLIYIVYSYKPTLHPSFTVLDAINSLSPCTISVVKDLEKVANKNKQLSIDISPYIASTVTLINCFKTVFYWL